jgi:class 3 adenylate cyclase
MTSGTAQQGYLTISDITGYTAFLSRSELEHAEDSLRSLLNVLLEQTKAPLVVSRLEGDAVISYAPEGSFLQGQTLVEAVEGTYVAFRQALERMVLNTTCTCRACKNIPNLDLKFFVHHGTFMLQSLGSHVELIGNDVNLVHRLTKNSVTEKTGLAAYALYTQAASDALGIGEMCAGMATHIESYEHVGSVVVHVQDLEQVWQKSRDLRGPAVDPDDALLTVEYEFPVGLLLAWDFLTKPEYRAVALGSDTAEVTGRSDGRLAPGSVYVCAHGEDTFAHQIVDWRPFDQFTTDVEVKGAVAACTAVLSASDTGTRVSFHFGRARGPFLRGLGSLHPNP